ncbi:MAG: tetratricopeptide repeat protein [Candidatus Zixiibacteriota bacterium]
MKELIANYESNQIASGITDGFALLTLARDWLKQGNPVVAIELLRSALETPESLRDRELHAQILKESGRAMMMQSSWDQAEFYYTEAQRQFVEMEDFNGAAQCARNRANMLFQQGQYRKSEELCDMALDWATSINDYQLRASILNTLGAIKSATGELQESIKLFRLCLSDFESSGNKVRQGYVLLNIGLTQTELGEHIQAIESLNRALAFALEEKDLNLVEICYQNISKCYLARKEIKLAKSVIDTARKILPGLSSPALEAELNLIDCKILRMSGNLEAADTLLKKTYQMALDKRLSALEADILFEQGQLEKELGNNSMAIAKINAAINQYRIVGVDQGLQEAIRVLEQLKRGSL